RHAVEFSCRSGRKITEEDVHKVTNFQELDFPDQLYSNITKAGYSEPTTIQKYAIHNILRGKDLIACSKSGSGKTATFLLPIISYLMRNRDLSTVSNEIRFPSGLILVPSSKKAMQIHNDVGNFSSGSSIK
ncbi:hypothetical protein PMAYCL1PPCAC_24965, partial [Pristionchus mayeri]